jgi:hypothetical protein
MCEKDSKVPLSMKIIKGIPSYTKGFTHREGGGGGA